MRILLSNTVSSGGRAGIQNLCCNGNTLSLGRSRPIIFGMQRHFRWLVVALVLVAAAPVWSAEVVRIRVEDTIQPASQQFIERALAEAVDRDAELVVMELDTPGGLLDTNIAHKPLRRTDLESSWSPKSRVAS